MKELAYRPSRFVCVVLCLALTVPLAPWAGAQQARTAPASSGKDLIAVMDFENVGASKTQASALTDRVREELLRSGSFTLVDRAQMDNVLKEQATQQTGCTSQECAVQVGKILGVRKLVTGRITKVDENLWLLSAQIIDVETAETMKAESVQHEGTFAQMLAGGAVNLAGKLAAGRPAQQVAQPAPAVPRAQTPPAPIAQSPAPQPEVNTGGGSSWWWWVLGGALVLGAAAASGDNKKQPSNTGTVNIAW